MFVPLWLLIPVALVALWGIFEVRALERRLHCLRACYYALRQDAGNAFEESETSEHFAAHMQTAWQHHSLAMHRARAEEPSWRDLGYFTKYG